jgi:UDP-N-acetyl-2-amino-2-deoxyglucuronate dehydrogenase
MEVHHAEASKIAGFMELSKARVRWYLSLDKNDLPQQAVKKGMTTYRSVQINGQEFEFSQGFSDLHTRIYRRLLEGKGFGIDDARQSVNVAYSIRNAKPTGVSRTNSHPFLKRTG